MKITRFALGIRFAAMAEQPHKEFARKIFEGIFSVLTLSELEDLTLYLSLIHISEPTRRS